MNAPYNYYHPAQHIKQLQDIIQTQDRRINELEQSVNQLNQSVEQLNKKEPVTVNYKFDQLKIESLEGTLNIGLNPANNDESIEDFSVDQETIRTDSQSVSSDQESSVSHGKDDSLYDDIEEQLQNYFNEHALNDLQSIENHFQYTLDPPYRTFIIDDVKKQLGHRIQYYLNQIKDQTKDRHEQRHQVTEKVINDVRGAFKMFIENLPKGRDPS